MISVITVNVIAIFYCGWLSKLKFRIFLVYWISFLSINTSASLFFELPASGSKLKALLMFFLLVLIFTIFSSSKRKIISTIKELSNPIIITQFAFLFIMIFWLVIPDDKDYGTTKLLMFIFNSMIPCMLFIMLGPYSQKELRNIINIIIFSSIFLSVLLFLNPVEVEGMRNRLSLNPSELHPNKLSRDICTGLLLMIVSIFIQNNKRTSISFTSIAKPLVLITLVLLMIVVSFKTGSRGPLAMVAAVAFVVLITQYNLKFLISLSVKFLLIITIIIGVSAVVDFNKIAGPQLQRILVLFENVGENQSDQSRLYRQAVALDAFIESKGVGIGTGGFYEAWPGPPPGGINSKRDYPHNIFIETLSEFGVIGILLLIYITWISIKIYFFLLANKKNNITPEFILLYALWIYGFANAQVSGDIGTNYLVWVGAILVFIARKTNSTSRVFSTNNASKRHLINYNKIR